jgi:hypothetical protein
LELCIAFRSAGISTLLTQNNSILNSYCILYLIRKYHINVFECNIENEGVHFVRLIQYISISRSISFAGILFPHARK